MKISMLSKSDESGGGASRVAANLSYLLETTDEITVTKFAKTGSKEYIDLRGHGLNRFLYKATQIVSRMLGLPDIFTTEFMNFKKADLLGTDIFHVHDISSAISPFTLKRLSKIAPVIWTIHDCSPFTGGCIYPLSCTKYIDRNCSNCPQLNEWPLETNIDLTKHMQSLKINIINNYVKKVVCPSNWIAKSALAAGVSKDLITVIHNAVDTSLFHPEVRTENKQICLLLTSVDLNNKFKGGNEAINIINNLRKDVHVILIGRNASDYERRILSRHTITLIEPTFDSRILAFYYRKADLLLHTSVADNCPLTILESLSSGVPVITFETGGIPEIVTHNLNGWVSAKGDIQDAARMIDALDENRPLLDAWKKNARDIAVRNFNSEIFLSKHISVYREFSNAQ